MASPPFDHEREHRLIEQLELRVASANSDEKFQAIVQKFLAALLLKLASPNVNNRNLAIKVCQHILQRLKIDTSISVPTKLLLSTFRESSAALVRQITLVFIEQGLARVPATERVDILPELLRSSIPEMQQSEASDQKLWPLAFEFLLNALSSWKIPEHSTKEDIALREAFGLSKPQSTELSKTLSNYLIFDAKNARTHQDLSQEFRLIFEQTTKMRQHLVTPIAKLFFTLIFDDTDRFVPALVLSVDGNDSASTIADTMFKQCTFNLESAEAVDSLFMLYDVGRPRLQTRCLGLLSKSRLSTKRSDRIVDMVERQLFGDLSGLEAAKLRAAVFTYLNWAARASDNLEPIVVKLQVTLKEFIELQGWPSMQDPTPPEIDLRAKAYESIGLLSTVRSTKSTQGQGASIDLITWLFTSLRCDVSKDIRSSIDESLSRILGVTVIDKDDDKQRLKKLLLWHIMASVGDEDPIYFHPTRYITRYLALRFANKCLGFDDIDARYMDLIALGIDDRREVAEEAFRGLDPYWHTSSVRLTVAEEKESNSHQRFPKLKDFVNGAFGSKEARDLLHVNAASLAAAIEFGRNLLVTEALLDTPMDVSAQTDWRSRINALVTNDTLTRNAIKQYVLTCNSNVIIQLLENGLFGISQGRHECADISYELIALTPSATLMQLSPDVLNWCRGSLSNGVVQLQASRILGVLGSLSEQALDIANEALSKCSDWEKAIGSEAVSVRGYFLAATYICTRSNLRRAVTQSSDTNQRLTSLTTTIITQSRDKALVDAAYVALGQICLCIPSGNSTTSLPVQVQNHMLTSAKKEMEVAVAALGRSLNASSANGNISDYQTAFEAVFALHEVRKSEFQFAVGEALAVAALGFHSLSTTAEFDIEAPIPEKGRQPELFKFLLERCITDSRATKPSLRKATAIWLLCLIQYCANSDWLKKHLQACQAAFTGLLTDRDEIVQETGSRGLGLVYEKGDEKLREDLVRNLVQSFTGSTAKMSGTVTDDTQLFEAGALPTEGGQSITTYKDIVSLATEMGDPSLVYRFMNLASNNAIWTSRAAFGRFGLSGVLQDSSYLTENKKFYPKLFRYRFDPNPNVQRSMDDIWKALVKDPNQTIEDNFDVIMDDLLQSVISGKEWRAREASCSAIADLIQGRELEKFEKYLDHIWSVAFKVLDDVKETVRIAAMKLCRVLTNMLIRNLEVGGGATKRAATMMGHAIPFLLQQMGKGAAQEVQKYAVVTLLTVVKKAPLRSLQSFAPVILETLVLSLSLLEPEEVNWLHLNADKYGLTAEKLDQMRVSSINSSPVTEAIERCLESLNTDPGFNISETAETVKERSQNTKIILSPIQDGMKRLEKAFKSAIGLPSKIGLSRVIVTLVVRYHMMFRPFADRFVQLTRKSILDRNATISVSFSVALAYLMRLASDEEVQETNRYAQKLYFESLEISHRSIAGEILQAISTTSNDVFMRYAAAFLPFAFIGRQDLDTDVRSRFDPPWKDNIGGARALNLYLPEIVDLISAHIGSSSWSIKQACCLAVADLVSSRDSSELYTEKEARLLWTVVRESLGGKTWEGKEKVIQAFPNFVKKAEAIWSEQNRDMKAIAMREAKRTNVTYRAHAIEALGRFALFRTDPDFSKEIFRLMTNITAELADDDNAMEVDGDSTSKSRFAEPTRVAILKCVFHTLPTAIDSEILDQATTLIKTARDHRSPAIDVEIYDSAHRFISQAIGKQPGPAARDSIKTADNGQARNSRRDLLEAFLPRLVLATFSHDRSRHASDSEKIRKSRIDLAVLMAGNVKGLLNKSTCDILVAILKEWSPLERSRLLQQNIDKAVALITSSEL